MKNLFLIILFMILSLSNTGIQTSKKPGVEAIGFENKDADLYIISIGINKYKLKGGLEFRNCTSDAKKATAFLTTQFNVDSIKILVDSTRFIFNDVYSYTLLNEQATYSSLDSLFQIVSETAKPEDFFVFFFAGFSWDFGLNDSLHQGIYFVPFTEDSITWKGTKLKVPGNFADQAISLRQLKTWFELIPANKQLIITEAGPNDNFFNEFISTLIENDRIIARLTKKNRVIATTHGAGRDSYECRNDFIEAGPLLDFISNIPSEVNIFQLFDNNFKEKVKYYIIKNEIECGIHPSGTSNSLYSAIYFEKDVLEMINEIEKTHIRTRGTESLNENLKLESISPTSIKNYALVIGTDEYNDPMWPRLSNPVLDATTIAARLQENYSFDTKILINPTRDEILHSLLEYKQIEFDSLSQLLVFIAGHGNYDDFSKGIIATKDSKNPEDDPFADTYISHSKLRDWIDGFKCDHIMVVLDVCFGGTFSQNLSSNIISEGEMNISGDENSKGDYQGLEVTQSEFIMRKMGKKTRLYMTSGGKEYVPDGIPGHHSPFASKFINALDSKGGEDYILTYGEIKSFVEKLTPWPKGGTFGSKSDGDFLFMASKN